MARTTRGTRGKKASGSISVDFTGVESSGRMEEGRHLLTVDGTPEVRTSENSGTDYINWKLKGKGGVVYHTTSLQPQALWNLRNVLEAMGLEVPEGALDLDLDEMDGMTLGGEIIHEVYQGKRKAVLADIFPVSELDGEEGAEEEGAEEEESEETEVPTYEEVQEAEKDELLELAEEHGIKLSVKVKKSVQALRDFICEKLELEEEEESEEESEDELTYEVLAEMDKDELLEVAQENEIKLTLKQKKTAATLLAAIAEKLGLEEESEEEGEEAPKTTSRRKKTSSGELKKGSQVQFVDDGEELEGVVKSINTKEKFAVVDIDGDEWEVELSDLTVI